MTIRQQAILESMLREHHNAVSLDDAMTYDQLFFGSCCTHCQTHPAWIDWDPVAERFKVNADGLRDLREIRDWDPHRLDHNLPLGSRTQRRMATQRRRFTLLKKSA